MLKNMHFAFSFVCDLRYHWIVTSHALVRRAPVVIDGQPVCRACLVLSCPVLGMSPEGAPRQGVERAPRAWAPPADS